jgi:hypothetical protein
MKQKHTPDDMFLMCVAPQGFEYHPLNGDAGR